MKTLEDLIDMMAQLRAPNGCPWDREQSFATLAPMLVEEVYEAIEAAEEEKWYELRDEIGDVLFQLVFYSQIASEQNYFTLHDAITSVYEKMWRRHPHIFGNETASSTTEVLANWEAIKAEERKAAGKDTDKPYSLLDGVSKKIPALLEAHQLTTKAARVGFDWDKPEDVFAKLQEEIVELQDEIDQENPNQAAMTEELGDLMFVAVNLARKLGVEPEAALKGANRKFRRRFHHIEVRLSEQEKSFADSNLAEMDTLWDEAKMLERKMK